MNTIIQEIVEAVKTANIGEADFAQLDKAKSKSIVSKAMATFVDNSPRVWWLSLKLDATYYDYPDCDGLEHLLEHVPPNVERCYFIPETETNHLPVYRASVVALPAILRECSFFEYYVVGIDMSWLVIENDHNQIISCKTPSLTCI